MTAMISAVVEPCDPSAIRTVNAPADQAPRYGMYAAAKLTSAIAPACPTPSTSAPRPITMALNAATAVTPVK